MMRRRTPLPFQQIRLKAIKAIGQMRDIARLAQIRREIEQPQRFQPIVERREVVNPRVDEQEMSVHAGRKESR